MQVVPWRDLTTNFAARGKAAPALTSVKDRPGPRTRRSCCVMTRSSSVCRNLESLPLFATDTLLGAALLGPDRVSEWLAMTPLLETKGLPKIDPLMHGRYVPAVRAFFDHLYGLDRNAASTPPLAPDGVEDFETWKSKSRRS